MDEAAERLAGLSGKVSKGRRHSALQDFVHESVSVRYGLDRGEKGRAQGRPIDYRPPAGL